MINNNQNINQDQLNEGQNEENQNLMNQSFGGLDDNQEEYD